MSNLLVLQVKWRGLVIRFDNVDPDVATVGAIKAALEEKTGIAPMDQKLIGLGVKLTKATTEDENIKLRDISLKAKNNLVPITLMGTPQVELIEQQAKEFEQLTLQNKVFNDLDFGNLSPATREWKKLHDFSSKVEIQFVNPPRPGRKLLILDLDHTLMHFDSKDEGASGNLNVNTQNQNHATYVTNHNETFRNTMKRPYMEYFLTSVYPHYDIAIWSQTHWKWIEIKLTELGIIPNSGYKICFILDKSSMFKIPPSGYVKPIHIVWSKFPHLWNKTNTVHVDDMERNFVLNKQSGVMCTPFYRMGYTNAKNDILTTTLSRTAYGPNGLILSSISTTSANYYFHRQSFATAVGSVGNPFPAPGSSSSSSASPAPGSDEEMWVSLPPIGSAQHAANVAAHANSVMATDDDTNKHQGKGEGPDNVVPRARYTLASSKFVHPPPTHTAAHPSNIIASNSSHDVELYYLSRYLCNLAAVKDLSTINHSHWRLHSHTVMPASPAAVPQPDSQSRPPLSAAPHNAVGIDSNSSGSQSARAPAMRSDADGRGILLSQSAPGSHFGTPRSGSPISSTSPRNISPVSGRLNADVDGMVPRPDSSDEPSSRRAVSRGRAAPPVVPLPSLSPGRDKATTTTGNSNGSTPRGEVESASIPRGEVEPASTTTPSRSVSSDKTK